MVWEYWKKSFDTWESKTAPILEKWLKSSAVLEPMGAALNAFMKAKIARDKAVASWWSTMGLATKRDQERALHALNQLQSRLIDLEQQLSEARKS